MSFELSILDVREDLAKQAGRQVQGGPPELLGRIFHQILGDLVGRAPERNAFRILFGLDRDLQRWRSTLLDECYRTSIGPRLSRHQAHLQASSPAVLGFWDAIRNLIDWLAQIAWEISEDGASPSWEQLATLLRPPLLPIVELEEPGWSDSVRLVDGTEGLIRVPPTNSWCAVNLKLGGSDRSDASYEAALLRLIRSRLARNDSEEPHGTDATVSLVYFTPDRKEWSFDEGELREAEQCLISTIGRLARVTSRTAPPPVREGIYASIAKGLVEAYSEYGKEIEITDPPSVGPRFLRFEARLGKRVRYDQIKGLTQEIGLRLGTTKDPIVSRCSGRLVIDVARPDPESVPFSRVMKDLGAIDPLHGSARLLAGVSIDGRCRFANLSDPINAHVLVAGTTGSGKTEWLRSAIASLLVANTPATMRLVLLDPKQTAFTDLKQSPFLWSPYGFWVPGDKVQVAQVLSALEAEMERRYKLLAEEGVDDLRSYQEKTRTSVSRIVLVCDEYYALLGQADREERKSIERSIGLIGAKARAAGIHLVLAMQQASRKVIQGSIDTNIPCRVALMTSSAIESRMVLQADGADQLTGYGDLLYKDIGEPVRLQAPLMTPQERQRLFSASVQAGQQGVSPSRAIAAAATPVR